MAQRELSKKYRMVNGKCVPDPNGPIEVIIVLPDITPEENERRKRQIEKDVSRILGVKAKFRH
jgi:hypothetical protein